MGYVPIQTLNQSSGDEMKECVEKQDEITSCESQKLLISSHDSKQVPSKTVTFADLPDRPKVTEVTTLLIKAKDPN